MDDLLRSMSTLPVDDVVVRLAELAGREPAARRGQGLAGRRHVLGRGVAGAGASVQAAYRVDVRHRGDRVGEIEIAAGAAPLTPLDRRLLDELAGPAGVALSTVRLTVDLRRREAQLTDLTRALAVSSDRLRGAGSSSNVGCGPRSTDASSTRVPRRCSGDDEQPDPSTARQEASAALDELVRWLAESPTPAAGGWSGRIAGWLDGALGAPGHDHRRGGRFPE